MRVLALVLTALGALSAAVPSRGFGKDPGAQPLGAARVTLLEGPATVEDRPLRGGDPVAPGQRVRVGAVPGARLELRFPDGSLARLGPATDLLVAPGERRLLLRAGRALVQADRMIGGVALWTPRAALEPLGTTYVVELSLDHTLTVLVLEGAVQVLAPAPERVLLPGEALRLPPDGPADRTAVQKLDEALAAEPLLRAFPTPLPTLARIQDLADQQRRGVLTGRNERLRRELGWRRPPRRPILLPELFR